MPTLSADQIETLRQRGQISYQQAMAAMAALPPQAAPVPAVGAPTDNSADKVAQAQATAANDLSQGTTANGQTIASQTAPSPTAKQLVVNPQAAQPAGATDAGGSQPDGALSQFVAGMPAGGQRKAGMSKADTDFAGSLDSQQQNVQQQTADTIARTGQIASNFAQQSDAVAAESKAGLLSAQQDMQANAARRADLMAQTKQSQAKIQSKLDELEAQGVDPNHYWREQSTGSKIAAGILVGFGGFAQGMNAHLGGHNAALDIINGAIERDVDAQKTNLQQHLGILGKRMEATSEGFQQQDALLKAEQDSIATGYSIASNEINKRAALYKDNADLQQHAATMTGALNQTMQERLGHLTEQRYQLAKSAERIVPGNDPRAAILAAAAEVQEKANARGVPMSHEQSLAVAMNRHFGTNLPEVDTAKPLKGGSAWQKAQQKIPALESAISGIDDMIKQRDGAGIIRGANANARAGVSSQSARADLAAGLGGRVNPKMIDYLTKLVPEDPLEHNAAGLVGQDPTKERLLMAKRVAEQHLNQLRANPNAGPTEDANQGGFEEENEDE